MNTEMVPEQTEANGVADRRVANCDQEAWVKARIRTAIRMASSVASEAQVGADGPAMKCALDGIVNGTAVEIIQTLGMVPEYTNLRRP